ncbi:MAG: hypothetical protein WKF35_12415 [Ferruginibacter sp.]
MQVKKELLLFCTILILSITLLIAAGVNKSPLTPVKKCSKPSQCCHKPDEPHPNATPWNLLYL